MPQEVTTRLESIVEKTIELLDEEGLAGLSMRSLGARLNTAATAVYWHVKSKDELIMLAGAQVWDEIALPDLTTTPWRDAGMNLARELSAMLARHPWLVQTLGSYLQHGRGKARFDDHSLAVYEMAGFSAADADQAVAVVFMFVLGSAMGQSASQSLRRTLSQQNQDANEVINAAIAQQVEVAQEFPRLRARVEGLGDADYYGAPRNSFEFGLEAIFDGLERQLQGSGSPVKAQVNRVTGWYA